MATSAASMHLVLAGEPAALCRGCRRQSTQAQSVRPTAGAARARLAASPAGSPHGCGHSRPARGSALPARTVCRGSGAASVELVVPVFPTPRLAALAAQFTALPEGQPRLQLLLSMAAGLPAMAPQERSVGARVQGCTSQTWLTAHLEADGTVSIAGACWRSSTPSHARRGLCVTAARAGCLVKGARPSACRVACSACFLTAVHPRG